MYLSSHSYYSLRYGTIPPEELLQLAAENDIETLALTDINNTSACLDFIRLSKKYNIKPVVGIDFRNKTKQQFIGLAKNNEGYYELNLFLSKYFESGEEHPERAPSFPNAYVIYPFNYTERSFGIDDLNENEYIGIRPDDLNRLKFHPWRKRLDKMVMVAPITFRNKRDFNAHRLLRAIDNNTLLSKLPKKEEGNSSDQLLSESTLRELFQEFPEIIQNTERLFGSCEIHFEFGSEIPPQNLSTYTESEEDDYQLIKKLCDEGLSYRYPEPTQTIYDRIHKELEIIREKQYLSYFLINWDITRYARSKGYFYVGRGSGANSIIAYILRITDVDPIELDLYFERFINLYRKNPPDFDIDFSWTDREDITQYIFSNFRNVTLLGAYVTFQYKAVVRELGKVFGLPKSDIDLLSDGKFEYEKLDSIQQLVLQYSAWLQDFPNHISIHAAGILITDKPIQYFTATFLPPKGFPTTHFDMVVAEDVGIYKFDILSQRGLGKIKECVDIIRYNQPDAEDFDIHDMKRFKRDERIKDLLRNAKAIGCFYVESPAMRMLLTKLQVDDYLGLVAASSVIRPGVSRSGMMREFIMRHRYPEKRKEAHPVMLDIMPETYGVMVYQEDVIKVAHYFGGLDLGEADSLRRGMSGKFRGREEFEKARLSFFKKAKDKGHPDEMIAEVWRQVESFAGYAFAKGHSASYAVESYQSLFLKAYYPLEYMTATINNFGGFYSTELYVHEARMHGAIIEPPCVLEGSAVAVMKGKRIILGMGLVKDIEHDTIIALLDERNKNGAYLDFEDFISRVRISLEQITILIRVGAFRYTKRSKKELLWAAHFALAATKMSQPDQGMFVTPVKTFTLPPLEHSWLEDSYDELELIGFALCNPFDLLQDTVGDDVLAADLPHLVGKSVTVVGYLVTIKPSRTAKGERMYFGTFLDRAGNFLDTVHFPPISERYAWRGKGIYIIKGKVSEEFGAISIEAQYLEKIRLKDDPRYA
jgi:DNA polymerase-3 subunit alpha